MKVLLCANSDWYLFNFRAPLARKLRQQDHEVVLVSPDGAYRARLQQMGFEWRQLPMDRSGTNPFKELAVFFRLARIIRGERPDVVHLFTLKCVIYGAIACRALGRIPCVGAVAGLGYAFSHPSWRARTLRVLMAGLMSISLGGSRSRVIVQNPSDGAVLAKSCGIPRARIRLIPSSGVDCARFHPDAKPGSDESMMNVVMAARLLRSKGVYEYVEAARILRGRGRPVQFFLAGTTDDGNPDSVPEAVLAEWIEDGVVKHLGHVERMEDVFRACDVAVLPSYYGEGLPRSLIEAAASGLAIITTDLPGCRDAVVDGITGIMVPPKDIPALVCGLEFLDADRGALSRFGAAARERALSEFDEEIVNAKTMDVYMEMAS